MKKDLLQMSKPNCFQAGVHVAESESDGQAFFSNFQLKLLKVYQYFSESSIFSKKEGIYARSSNCGTRKQIQKFGHPLCFSGIRWGSWRCRTGWLARGAPSSPTPIAGGGGSGWTLRMFWTWWHWRAASEHGGWSGVEI